MQLKAFDNISLKKVKYIEGELRKLKPEERPKRLKELLKMMDEDVLQDLAEAFGGELID